MRDEVIIEGIVNTKSTIKIDQYFLKKESTNWQYFLIPTLKTIIIIPIPIINQPTHTGIPKNCFGKKNAPTLL